MALYNFHRVLIGVSILFDFGFTWWALRRYFDSNDTTQLLMAIGSTIVTIVLIAYLVYFNRNLAVMRHALRGGLRDNALATSPAPAGNNGHD